MKNVNIKDVALKTLRTFIAAFVGVYLVALANLLTFLFNGDLNSLQKAVGALLPAAIAAGATAAYHAYSQYKNPSVIA